MTSLYTIIGTKITQKWRRLGILTTICRLFKGMSHRVPSRSKTSRRLLNQGWNSKTLSIGQKNSKNTNYTKEVILTQTTMVSKLGLQNWYNRSPKNNLLISRRIVAMSLWISKSQLFPIKPVALFVKRDMVSSLIRELVLWATKWATLLEWSVWFQRAKHYKQKETRVAFI